MLEQLSIHHSSVIVGYLLCSALCACTQYLPDRRSCEGNSSTFFTLLSSMLCYLSILVLTSLPFLLTCVS
jgi:hypothetical protein